MYAGMYATEEAVQHYRRALEVLQDGGGDEAKNLDRDVSTEAWWISCFVDLSHAPRTLGSEDFVRAEASARRQRHRRFSGL